VTKTFSVYVIELDDAVCRRTTFKYVSRASHTSTSERPARHRMSDLRSI
jgi:hypothetical protein